MSYVVTVKSGDISVTDENSTDIKKSIEIIRAALGEAPAKSKPEEIELEINEEPEAKPKADTERSAPSGKEVDQSAESLHNKVLALAAKGPIKTSVAAKKLGVDKLTVKAVITDLINQGKLEKQGERRNTVYVLKGAQSEIKKPEAKVDMDINIDEDLDTNDDLNNDEKIKVDNESLDDLENILLEQDNLNDDDDDDNSDDDKNLNDSETDNALDDEDDTDNDDEDNDDDDDESNDDDLIETEEPNKLEKGPSCYGHHRDKEFMIVALKNNQLTWKQAKDGKISLSETCKACPHNTGDNDQYCEIMTN